MFEGGKFKYGSILDTINLGNGTIDRTSKMLAYRKTFNGYHNTGLGTIFFNLEALFPCAGSATPLPICRLLPLEDDGFLQGRTILEAADSGNNFRIFGNRVNTYGFAIKGCSLLNGINGCLPLWFNRALACYLPQKCL